MARIFRMSRAADDLQFMYAYTTRALSSKCVCVCVCASGLHHVAYDGFPISQADL